MLSYLTVLAGEAPAQASAPSRTTSHKRRPRARPLNSAGRSPSGFFDFLARRRPAPKLNGMCLMGGSSIESALNAISRATRAINIVPPATAIAAPTPRPKWVLPAALGLGGVLVILALKK